MVVGLHNRPARWLGRLWGGVRAWLAGSDEIPLEIDDLILDVDVWDDVPHVSVPVRPRGLPPPIPVEVRRALPAPPALPAQGPALAASPTLGAPSDPAVAPAPSRPAARPDSAWDEVIARAKASIDASASQTVLPQVALTPAPAWNDDPREEAQWSARLGRAKARARSAERRGRPPTGDVSVRWAELMAGAQSDRPAKPTAKISKNGRKRRRSSSISLACPVPAPADDDAATPLPAVTAVPAARTR